jgi:hypothetical protein
VPWERMVCPYGDYPIAAVSPYHSLARLTGAHTQELRFPLIGVYAGGGGGGTKKGYDTSLKYRRYWPVRQCPNRQNPSFRV